MFINHWILRRAFASRALSHFVSSNWEKLTTFFLTRLILLMEVASDNPTNYKRFWDRLNEMNGQRITMDVWTLEELRQVTPEEWTDGEVDFLYKVFGGRVRHVLCGNSNATSVDDVIESTAFRFFGNNAKQAY